MYVCAETWIDTSYISDLVSHITLTRESSLRSYHLRTIFSLVVLLEGLVAAVSVVVGVGVPLLLQSAQPVHRVVRRLQHRL